MGDHCEQMEVCLLGDPLRDHMYMPRDCPTETLGTRGEWKYTLVSQCFRVVPGSELTSPFRSPSHSLASSFFLENPSCTCDEKLTEHIGTTHYNYRWTLGRVKGNGVVLAVFATNRPLKLKMPSLNFWFMSLSPTTKLTLPLSFPNLANKNTSF